MVNSNLRPPLAGALSEATSMAARENELSAVYLRGVDLIGYLVGLDQYTIGLE